MADTRSQATIDPDRLRALFDGVNAFGRSGETGGYNRPAFSQADMDVRRWFAQQMEETGLAVHWDEAGSVFGRWGDPDRPAVMAGSHLDTVPEGGAFDGALGVCIALESVRALMDAGIEPEVPVEVAVTSDEEGRFGAMLGSQAMVGQMTPERIDNAVDSEGVRLVDAMAAHDLDAHAIPAAARPAGSVSAFLELHVEQGPVLEAGELAVGIVEQISGVCNWQVTLTGVANHSGTTPMEKRADAFAGVAEIAATIPSVIAITGGDQSRVTVGKIALSPNFPHTIPGKAVFNMILRDTDEGVMKALTSAFRALIDRVAKSHSLEATVEEMSWLSPTKLDGDMADLVEAEARHLDLAYTRMPSGAGHDAQTMQAICPSGLIFVPSRDGISHAPEEWTAWADIEKGAALYLSALTRLATGLPPRADSGTTPQAGEGDDAAAGLDDEAEAGAS